MLDEKGVISVLREFKPMLAEEGIELIGYFGSYARGEATPQSDVDILIETKERFVRQSDPLAAFSRLRQIKGMLQRRLGQPVDLADLSGLGRTAKEIIMGEIRRV